MNCPKCNAELHISDRQGVEIDYCPQCRGVWLDRGELDKIIERSASYDSKRRDDYDDDDYNYREEHGKRLGHPRKRKGFLGDLFDFD